MRAARNETDWRMHREMSEELRAICVKAVSKCSRLPLAARKNANAIESVEITNFDQGYIEFLDQQIAVEPRGRKWSETLKIRRLNLSQHVGTELASCRLTCGGDRYWIKIDPTTGSVVHWEGYDETE